jgi:pumilio family protein 6
MSTEAAAHLLFPSCQELLAEIVHTKDGSRVVRDFLARGTAKV